MKAPTTPVPGPGRPCVVGTLTQAVTLTAPNLADVCAGDWVEIRLDMVGPETPDWLAHARRIEAAGWPVLLTLRLAAEGGQWQLPDEERIQLLTAAVQGLTAIDVEARSPLAVGLCRQAAALGKTVIVSFHDFSGTPPLSELQARVDAMRAFPSAIPKLVTTVKRPGDCETLAALLAANWQRPLCVLGMGALGAATRVDLPASGSCLTYGFLDAPSAPGQFSARDLVARLRARLPAYDAAWRVRHEVVT